MIPIRIDLDIPSFTPAPALPLPSNATEFGINPSLPAYRQPEPTTPFRLKDTFLWNLHETLMTPDQFAMTLVNDLDLPNPAGTAVMISTQIRTQLEEYAGVALHPLFHSASVGGSNGATGKGMMHRGRSRDVSATPAATTPLPNGISQVNGHLSPAKRDLNSRVTASATSVKPPTIIQPSPEDRNLNPDDTYRCILTLNINLHSKLYTDKFEWSLLHPPGVAEAFAKQTCADLGLAGEWVPAVTHAIYEAVLRLKKEACESGGLVGTNGYGGDIDNLAAEGKAAGWRYDPDSLGDDWEPKCETLSKEEIEKREGDRERQIRRLRRETARFSSSTGLYGSGMAQATPMGYGGAYFDLPDGGMGGESPAMGRGERSKKKRRFRSLSPSGRGGTPGGGGAGGRGTPDGGSGHVAGYGGGGGLNEWFVPSCPVLSIVGLSPLTAVI